jgi:hypothetical protein
MTIPVFIAFGAFILSSTSNAQTGGGRAVVERLQSQPELQSPRGRERSQQELDHEEDLVDLMLVKAAGGKGVVRFGTKPLQVVSVGDRLGRTRAEVKEIANDRLVLEEIFRDANGEANRAVIVLKDGERGGKRYVARSTERAPDAVRPNVVGPDIKK